MGQKLTAFILHPDNGFNEQYRVLTLNEGEVFTVGIKEYEEAKKEFQKKIDDIRNEKNIIDANLKTEENRLFQQAQERYREGGKWIEPKKVNGKIVSQAQETYDANIEDARARVGKLKDQKNAQIKVIENELSTLESTFSSVVWAWNLAYSRSSKPSGKNELLGVGEKEQTLTLRRHLHGGGFAWIEPFLDGDKPTGILKTDCMFTQD